MREETMKKGGAGLRVAVAIMVAGTWLAGAGVANATLPIQKKAKELGFKSVVELPVLSRREAAQEGGRDPQRHGEVARRRRRTKRKATKEVDAAWLKDYVEKKADEKK